ncbi:MAG TPA: hypothetical protein DCQ98_09355 [Planctomycetaceae bacterium]|nr:hypothetical protein [Planctomycetaceae bacterium]HRE99569.1 hypothetical protein [Pirellulaceae bacterium]
MSDDRASRSRSSVPLGPLMGAILLFGLVTAIGVGLADERFDWRKPAIVLAGSLLFLGPWWWMLARRRR